MVTTYGKQTEQILEHYKTFSDTDNYLNLLRAELKFAIEFEMVVNPLDFFIRRTGRLYFDIDSVRNYIQPLLADFKNYFGYNNEKLQQFEEAIQREIKLHSDFSMERKLD